MQAFTHFSRHAFERIAKRTKLTCEEIARILDRKLTINTGRKPGFNRDHLLFYSSPDDDFFVAIQDSLTGTVVTVLPLDYHTNLAWSISAEDCGRAKDICHNKAHAEDAQPQQKSQVTITPSNNKAHADDAQPQHSSNAVLFVISGHFLDSAGNQKTKVIQKINTEPYGSDVMLFLSDQSFFSRLDVFAAETGIDAKAMFGITIRLGNHGAPIAIDLKEVLCPNTALQWDAPQAARP